MKSLLIDKNFATVTEKANDILLLPEGVDLNTLRVMHEGEPKPYTVENACREFVLGAPVIVKVKDDEVQGTFLSQEGEWFTLSTGRELVRVKGESIRLLGSLQPRLTFEGEADVLYIHRKVESDVFYQATFQEGNLSLSFWVTVHNRDGDAIKCQADVILNPLNKDSSELHSIPLLMIPALSSRCFCLWSEKFKVHSVINVPVKDAGEIKGEMYVAGISPRYLIPGSLTYISKYYTRQSTVPSVLRDKPMTISLGATDLVKGEVKIKDDGFLYQVELVNRSLDRVNVDVTIPLEERHVHKVSLVHLAKTKYTIGGGMLHVIFPFVGTTTLTVQLGKEPKPEEPEAEVAPVEPKTEVAPVEPEAEVAPVEPEAEVAPVKQEAKPEPTVVEDEWKTVPSRQRRRRF